MSTHRRDLERLLQQQTVKSGLADQVIPVVYIDLDQFGQVNEWLGFEAGDGALAEVELRLAAVAGHGSCARAGGDEFICLLPACAPTAVRDEVQALMRTLSTPLQAAGERLHLSASAGVSLYPLHAAHLDTLLHGAGAALRRAKRNGKNRIEVFSPLQPDPRGEMGRLGSALRSHIDENQFHLRFQPQVSLEGALVAFEALAGWQHPELGSLEPARFISVAEDCGRISELGDVLLSLAARQTAQWRLRYGFGGRVAVNVSALQFERTDFADRVQAALQAAQLPCQCLELEITETRMISDVAAARHACLALRELGVSICLDDFGVGFASLRLVQDLPLDAIKLDRSFVRDLSGSPDVLPLVEAVVHIARRRGLRLIAEGVETAEQLSLLAAAGCDAVQGYLLSPPLDAEAATLLLAEHRHWGNLHGRARSTGV